VREDATLIIGACRVLGSVAQWTTIKAMQKEVSAVHFLAHCVCVCVCVCVCLCVLLSGSRSSKWLPSGLMRAHS
jgi:hypothetical protein